MIFRALTWFSLVGLELEGKVGRRCVWGERLRKLADISQVLTILCSLLHMLWFCFLKGWLQRLWVRILLSYMIWSFVYLTSHTPPHSYTERDS